MLELLFLAAALLGMGVAAYTDWKYRIIPNRLTFPLIAFGLGGHLLLGFYRRDFDPFLLSTGGTLLLFLLGYLFWMLGGWSHGDTKALLFLAALLPRYPDPLRPYFSPLLAPYPFALTLLFNSFLVALPLLFLYGVSLTYRKVGLARLFPIRAGWRESAWTALLGWGAYSLARLTHPFAVLPFFLFLLPLGGRRRVQGGLALLPSGALLAVEGTKELGALLETYLVLFLGVHAFRLLWNSLGMIRREGLRKTVRVEDLREGMVMAEEIYRQGEEIFVDRRSLWEKLIESARSGELRVTRGDIVVGTSAAGIGEEEVRLLQRYRKEGKIGETLQVKETLPFGPPILLCGLLFSLLFGDLGTRLGGWLR
jgi:preflagellin peptidase FlaK